MILCPEEQVRVMLVVWPELTSTTVLEEVRE
jgi:hypothetical protein